MELELTHPILFLIYSLLLPGWLVVGQKWKKKGNMAN